MVVLIEDKDEKFRICKGILTALPEWFGIPQAIEEYAQGSRNLPLWADVEGGLARGMIVYRPTSAWAGEIYVMGVRKEYQGAGIGRKLFQGLFKYAKALPCKFLTVKTVQEGLYTSYGATNAFYKRMGFLELECLPELWDKANPCQIYIMCCG